MYFCEHCKDIFEDKVGGDLFEIRDNTEGRKIGKTFLYEIVDRGILYRMFLCRLI